MYYMTWSCDFRTLGQLGKEEKWKCPEHIFLPQLFFALFLFQQKRAILVKRETMQWFCIAVWVIRTQRKTLRHCLLMTFIFFVFGSHIFNGYNKETIQTRNIFIRWTYWFGGVSAKMCLKCVWKMNDACYMDWK